VSSVLESVVNVSEGRRTTVLDRIGAAAGPGLLDVHRDPVHHRSVLTLAGPADALEHSVRAVTRAAVGELRLEGHVGVHPRFGVVDVVPFVDLERPRETAPTALAARDRFARWAADELSVPCFCYGPERSLPELRRRAWSGLDPDTGPGAPHPTAGAIAVGARPVLVAWNLWLADADPALARRLVSRIRGPAVRALALDMGGGQVQVSCNLIDPLVVGPAEVWTAIAAEAVVARAELVGLIPQAVLDRIPHQRWRQLDLDPSRTIEARLVSAGL
jgi:glutamate formiminotransferase